MPHAATPESNQPPTRRFGRTTVQVVHGNVFCVRAESIVCPANRRGMMVAGAAGLIRLRAGAEIEREIMSRAPLTLGTSVSTGSGDLINEGIKYVFHAVVFNDLGSSTRLDLVERAVESTLLSAERHRVDSIVIPPIGSGVGSGRLAPRDVYNVIVSELSGHLRRYSSRIGTVTIASPDPREVREIGLVLDRAHRLWRELQVS